TSWWMCVGRRHKREGARVVFDMRNLIALSLLAALPLSAQQPRAARPLPAPNAELEEPWSGPLQLLELKNGDVLVHDSREKRLVVTSFASQEQREAAREGSGPQEYRSVNAMWRVAGDTVHVLDLMQQRILVLGPTGRAVRTQPMPGARDRGALKRQPMTRSVDAQGRWYGEGRDIRFEGGRMSFGDSVVVVRTDPRTQKADSLIKFYNIVEAPEMASAQSIRMRVPGYPKYDIWGVFPDGRVMMLRADGYVPEIVLPNGTRRRAAALPYPRLPVTEADKRTMMDSVQKALEEGLRQAAGMVPAGAQMPKFDLVPPEPW